jgi:teichuronic acid biosynthesis glycosyltransferase TuaG
MLSNIAPRVSIIMPAYNAEQWISEAIQSVINQTFSEWELIIVNDNSNDKTAKIAAEFALKDLRVKVFNLVENNGVSFARNFGIQNAHGEFIAFLDADDLWHSDKLKIQLSFHENNSECEVSHTNFINFNEYGKIRTPFKFFFRQFIKKKGNLLVHLLYFNSIATLTVVMKKKIFLDVNGFDCNLSNLEDQDLWLRISEKGNSFSYLDDELSFYRVHKYGLMSNIGKFKSAYKKFFIKHALLLNKYFKTKLSRAYYFRYFGIYYFKSLNYKLAFLYLRKAVFLSGNIYFQLITLPYVLISFFRFKIRKKYFI